MAHRETRYPAFPIRPCSYPLMYPNLLWTPCYFFFHVCQSSISIYIFVSFITVENYRINYFLLCAQPGIIISWPRDLMSNVHYLCTDVCIGTLLLWHNYYVFFIFLFKTFSINYFNSTNTIVQYILK
jgi:hypothetical protein